MVNMMYKCRKCQEVFSSAKFKSVNDAISAMIVLSSSDNTGKCISTPISIREIHKCYSGGLGIADLIGFIEVQDEESKQDIENNMASSEDAL